MEACARAGDRRAEARRAHAARPAPGPGTRGRRRRASTPPAWSRRAPAMQRVLDLARRVAQVDTTVLITGESGVGKERVARLIHDESARTAGPFVAINCGAVPETLLESELFGHARGSFTGATQDRPGLFEAANGGTLLLDEIGEVPPAMQVKLLRVLQEREVRRVGENKARRGERARAGRHQPRPGRGDPRRPVPPGPLLPAAGRRDARAAAARAARRHPAAGADVPGRLRRSGSGRKPLSLSPAAAQQLLRYDWPGNVRELENAIERAAVLATSQRIEVEDLPDEVRAIAGDRDRQPVLARRGGAQAHPGRAAGLGRATAPRPRPRSASAPPRSTAN